MAEWSNAVVLKTTDRLRGPGVRIPLPPPLSLFMFFYDLIAGFGYERAVMQINPGRIPVSIMLKKEMMK